MIRILYRLDGQVVCDMVKFVVFEEKELSIWFLCSDDEIYECDVSSFDGNAILAQAMTDGFCDLRCFLVRKYEEK
jgi:hypothetical protein